MGCNRRHAVVTLARAGFFISAKFYEQLITDKQNL